MFNHKKEWNSAICNNMNGSWGYDAMWHKYYLTYNLILKKWTNRYTKQTGGCQRKGFGVGKMGEGGKKVHTYIYEWINHGDIIYSMVDNNVLYMWKLLRR